MLRKLSRSSLARLVSAVGFAMAACTAPVAAAERQDHPRLWITADDLPRLRTWAQASNPVYQQGLRTLALQGATLMDSGELDAGDNAGSTWTEHTSEDYAALFALMALIDPQVSARPQWAARGRSMLMRILDPVDTCQRAQPPTANGRFCQLSFPVSDRSRWSGHSIPLAADWLQASTDAQGQPILGADDIAKVRRVFLVWSRLSMEAYPNPYNNPPEYSLPVGTIGDALLRLDTDLRRHRLRFSGNNYYAGHMRNMTLRALAIDVDDDHPDALTPTSYLRLDGNGQAVVVPLAAGAGAMRQVLSDVLRGWLHVQDYLLHHDSRGGLPQEGLEYMPTSIGIPGQMLLALDTAGLSDLAGQSQWGQQVAALINNPFYARIPEAILQSLSPRSEASANYGQVFKPAWYGDGEHYYFQDPIDILGPLALWADRHGDSASADAIRWSERHLPPDGSGALLSRARSDGNPGDVLSAVLYFLLFDPTRTASGPSAPDPRPTLAPWYWSDGMGRLLARTDWSEDATWFAFRMGYNAVDHQHGDGGMFEWYRQGEWLTKGTLGYGNDGGASDYKNTLTVENTIAAGLNAGSFLGNRLLRGAQMPQGRSLADPTVERRSTGASYHYLRGEMTGLYNAYYPPGDPTPTPSRALDVQEVSRDLLWLMPDAIVVYDRARGLSGNRRKRFWLNLPDNLPSVPTVSGARATAHTPGGQWLHATSVLPAARTLSIVTDDDIMSPTVNGYALGDEDSFIQTRSIPGGTEKYATRLMIEASGAPLDTRFLTVLEGGAAGLVPQPADALQSVTMAGCATAGAAFDGVARQDTAIWFARNRTTVAECVALPAPTRVGTMTVTGLIPDAGYALAIVADGALDRWQLTPGGQWQADGAGVLVLDRGPVPAAAARLGSDSTDVGFGAAYLGSSVQRSLVVSNRGLAASGGLSFAVTGDGGFSLSTACAGAASGLAAGASCPLELRFVPTTPGLKRAWLEVSENGQLRLRIGLSGMGEALPTVLFSNGFED
jgi:hypothetical protein